MASVDRPRQPLERLQTGIPGVDAILHGGVFCGGMYTVTGLPGSGKTIFGNQVCFCHVASGGRAIYVTLLAESHSRMLAHLESLRFYDPDAVANTLHYFSGYNELFNRGLEGLATFLRNVIRQYRAGLVVIDGMENVREAAASDQQLKRWLQALHAYSEATNCTLLLLAQPGNRTQLPEHTLTDGVIALHDQQVGLRAVRTLEVLKFRGSPYLRGQHLFEISGAGITVYPRTEALYATPTTRLTARRERLAFGVAGLDEMLRGGVLSGSSTLLLGPPGSGKTLLGLHFVQAGALAGQPSLHFSFYEQPPHLIEKADQIGLAFTELLAHGRLEIHWQPPLENYLDVYAERILATVRQRQIRRLFIDGLNGFKETAHPERVSRFLIALLNELCAHNVTTLVSVEMPHLFDRQVELPLPNPSVIIDNIVLLRYVELRSRLYRFLSILKVRASDYDSAIHEFDITRQGIAVAATSDSAETLLAGMASPRP